MKDRPILFSGPMVRALLDGRKTQTRRLIRTDDKGRCVNSRYAAFMRDGVGLVWRPYGGADEEAMPPDRVCEMVGYAPGSRLWVRETWAMPHGLDLAHPRVAFCMKMPLVYKAPDNPNSYTWRPSIHMPRWASRLTLTVTDVRVQRLQDISEEDAIAEGVTAVRDHCYVIRDFDYDTVGLCHSHPATPFAKLWDSINAKRPGASWSDNPFVVALTFSVAKRNIDALAKMEAA